MNCPIYRVERWARLDYIFTLCPRRRHIYLADDLALYIQREPRRTRRFGKPRSDRKTARDAAANARKHDRRIGAREPIQCIVIFLGRLEIYRIGTVQRAADLDANRQHNLICQRQTQKREQSQAIHIAVAQADAQPSFQMRHTRRIIRNLALFERGRISHLPYRCVT